MKKLFAAILMTISLSSLAGNSADTVGNAGFAKLSEAEKAEIIQLVAQKASQKESSMTSEDKVEKWVKIGSNIGQGLAGAAKEVGVAVNDFATTPVGQLTMLLIVWHMIGVQLIHVFGGILIWTVGFAVIRHMLKRAYPDIVEYDSEKTNIFGNAAIKSIKRMSMDDDNAAGWLFACLVILIAGLITMFSF